jgi:lysosomal alpha-glucosidase
LTVFPDFTLYEKTGRYWEKYIREFHQKVPFDGIWLDMNEIVGFCDGECKESKKSKPLAIKGKFDPNNPPYMPGGEKIYEKTLYMNSKTSLSMEYNTHDLYAHYENVATRNSLDKLYNKRSLIITRSSYSGTGHYSGKWLGDNGSNWKDLFWSISGVLNMNIFGIPMVGADICGFFGNTTAELCTRWYQVGSFYPFSRNHNYINSIPQEPWTLGNEVVAASRKALLNRYAILPYFYTLFYLSHINGGSVINSLPFEFPFDMNRNINYLDRQFMVGSALLVSPVLDQGARSVYAYFPTEGYSNVWYDFETGIEVLNTGRFQHIPAPLDHIPVHIRGGHIVPKQEPSMTTTDSRKNPFHLIVAAAGSLLADGSLYLDDGDSLDSISSKKFTYIQYKLVPGKLTATFQNKGFDVSHLTLKSISVYGAQNVCQVKLNQQIIQNYKYDFKTRILNIVDLKIKMSDAFEITWFCE